MNLTKVFPADTRVVARHVPLEGRTTGIPNMLLLKILLKINDSSITAARNRYITQKNGILYHYAYIRTFVFGW